MIEKILPATVAYAEAATDLPDAALFPAEAAIVAMASAERRRQFATGRACARRALGGLGVAPSPILPGAGGAPQWPPGIVGSITHCPGYRAAVVARAGDLRTIGIDAEPDAVLPDGVLAVISLPAERLRLRELAARAPGPAWDRLLFSAKESVYKAWFPLARRWLGFADAEIRIDPAGTFDARLPAAGADVGGMPLTGFSGRWLARDGLIVTAVTVPGRATV